MNTLKIVFQGVVNMFIVNVPVLVYKKISQTNQCLHILDTADTLPSADIGHGILE
ncbi:MAG: hypothetical protein QXI59_01530 [Candidatus Bathyarchaeia archaeon]